MAKSVKASALKKGDKLLLFSGKRTEPREVTITEIMEFPQMLRVDTSGGLQVLTPDATVETPD